MTQYCTACSNEATELTLDSFQKAIDLLFPTLHYALNKYTDRGTIYLLKETNSNPKCVIFHPDDLENVKSRLGSIRRLVDIKDEPLESKNNR